MLPTTQSAQHAVSFHPQECYEVDTCYPKSQRRQLRGRKIRQFPEVDNWRKDIYQVYSLQTRIPNIILSCQSLNADRTSLGLVNFRSLRRKETAHQPVREFPGAPKDPHSMVLPWWFPRVTRFCPQPHRLKNPISEHTDCGFISYSLLKLPQTGTENQNIMKIMNRNRNRMATGQNIHVLWPALGNQMVSSLLAGMEGETRESVLCLECLTGANSSNFKATMYLPSELNRPVPPLT